MIPREAGRTPVLRYRESLDACEFPQDRQIVLDVVILTARLSLGKEESCDFEGVAQDPQGVVRADLYALIERERQIDGKEEDLGSVRVQLSHLSLQA